MSTTHMQTSGPTCKDALALSSLSQRSCGHKRAVTRRQTRWVTSCREMTSQTAEGLRCKAVNMMPPPLLQRSVVLLELTFINNQYWQTLQDLSGPIKAKMFFLLFMIENRQKQQILTFMDTSSENLSHFFCFIAGKTTWEKWTDYWNSFLMTSCWAPQP